MSLLLSFVCLAAQLFAITALGSIVISIVSPSNVEFAILPIEAPTTIEVIDATLPCTTVGGYADDYDDDRCPETCETAEEYYGYMTVKQLKATCKEYGIKKYSALCKQELITLLSGFSCVDNLGV